MAVKSKKKKVVLKTTSWPQICFEKFVLIGQPKVININSIQYLLTFAIKENIISTIL